MYYSRLRHIVWCTFCVAVGLLGATNLGCHSPARTATAVPDTVLRKYHRDAARLALRWAIADSVAATAIYINKEDVEQIFSTLKILYAAETTVRKLEQCGVHTRPEPSMDVLQLCFRRDAKWASGFKNGNYTTENATFNALLSNYNIVIEKYEQINAEEDAVTLRAKEPLNMAALGGQLQTLDGFTQIVALPKHQESSSDIVVKKNIATQNWQLEYHLWDGAAEQIWKYELTQKGKIRSTESSERAPSCR